MKLCDNPKCNYHCDVEYRPDYPTASEETLHYANGFRCEVEKVERLAFNPKHKWHYCTRCKYLRKQVLNEIFGRIGRLCKFTYVKIGFGIAIRRRKQKRK